MFLKLQNADGSFPRKFRDDFTIVDKSGGSTPSATLPLVLGYKYFKDKRYLASARKTAEYLEKELISKADYFSSTLDANCEDKEASLYAATATYYLSLITKGEEHKHYADLTKKAAYFALSWYYLWDVPFAPGQMLGDIGMKTRGWGNVSVENNHIDVFVFEFADVLRWLSKEYKENRLSDFAEVISTSMRQLLPHEGHMCLALLRSVIILKWFSTPTGIMERMEKDITTIFLLPAGRLLPYGNFILPDVRRLS